jgi:hypothetical protein
VRMDQTCADGRRCCGFVFLSTDDHPYRPASGASPGADGYLFLLRGDGNLAVHRIVEGFATAMASSTGGTAPTPGSYVPLRITVTGSEVSFTRTDTMTGMLTVADATHRPVPVVHLGSTFAGVRFKNVVFS